MLAPEHEEILFTVERVRSCLDDLVVRGLSAQAAEELGQLRMLHAELERVGANHLGERLGTLIDSLEHADRGAAKALFKAQTSLRLFERILTLEAVQLELTRASTSSASEPASGDEADEP